MSIDESQVTAAVGAVTDPELRRPLAELGMVGSLQTRRKRVAVELALPVAHYPQVEELEERIRRAAGTVAEKLLSDSEASAPRTLSGSGSTSPSVPVTAKFPEEMWHVH